MADFELPGYELYERIGKGGMATVYRALHLNLDREVAIKEMDPAMNSDEQFSERFVREARISARLVHPHILQIYDVNVFENHNYIAMELLSGGDLADFIYGEMPQKVIYLVMEQMTAALDYAFSQGYVHRDIKPSNIMLRSAKEYVLADFGIARAANSGTQMTQTGLMVGTPSYMSPEQAKGVQLDGRSDLYALAVLLFEMLTKNLPYESDSPVTTAIMHLTEEIPTLPENLAAYQPFMNKAMAKDADDRYQTGKELFAAFMQASAGFDDDAILTPAHPKASRISAADSTKLAAKDNSQADQTQVSATTAGLKSRPYKLDHPRLSGTYASAPPTQKKPSSKVPLLLGLIVVGALSFGGYTWWQGQHGGPKENLSQITQELGSAYNAQNEKNLPKAASSFAKVLSMDSGNEAAQNGLSEIEAGFEREIIQALGNNDIDTAKGLISDFGLFFSSSPKWIEFSSVLDQMEQEIKLAAAQAERLSMLLEKANQQILDLAVIDAAVTLEQAKTLDSQYPGIQEAEDALVLAELEALANEERWTLYSVEERETFEVAIAAAKSALAESRFDSAEVSLAEANDIAPEMPTLKLIQAKLTAAREAIADLLSRADLAMAASAEDPAQAVIAAKLYRDVILADAANNFARTGLENVTEYYINAANQTMAMGDFAGSGEILTRAMELLPEQESISALFSEMPGIEQAWNEEQLLQTERLATVDALLDRGNAALAKIESNSTGAEEASNLYRQVLEIDPENSAAKSGVARLVDFYVDQANTAIKAAKFTTAGKVLASAESNLPNQPAIEQLQQQLPGMKKKWEDKQAAASQNKKLVAEARQRAIETVASGRAALELTDLEGARQAYDKAANTHAKLDETIAFKNELEAAYVAAIREQMEINKLDTALEYLDIGSALSPRSREWIELKSEIKVLQAGPVRRRLGAY
ncbi:MAG: serine/threonine-protein kinase PpkA [Halieaceae bacterium]|jgi:serine/threonine-protein kinase PpkA